MLLDGWCLSILWEELFLFYLAQQPQQLQLPPAPAYQDYLHWLAQQDYHAAECYWRDKLTGFKAPTPILLPRTEQVTRGHKQITRCLPQRFAEQLQHTAREQRVTLNTLLQVAWALLLSRYSGEHDIVFVVTLHDLFSAQVGVLSFALDIGIDFTILVGEIVT